MVATPGPSLEVGELRTQLSAAPIHCVSAREYQKCVGIMQKRTALRVPADTGIPQLQEASRTLVSDHGQEAHLNQIYQELQSVADELSRLCRPESLGSKLKPSQPNSS
ncbi:MAG: hypothetical protein R2710_25785 [Acidimicrobiales bacterium]